MTLTLANGPLAPKPPESVNYRVDGPKHKLFLDRFPRRVRAMLGDRVVLDTRDGHLLYETGMLAQLYVPEGDVADEVLEATDHSTTCPFKGEAAWWSVVAGERRAENAVWAYPEPNPGVEWLRGHLAFEWKAMDAWFDEDEEVEGHLRDPYVRVDVRDSSRRVRVRADGEVVAETDRPKLLSETGLPNRFYVPPEDVRRDLLEPSAKHTVCPYKGRASYHALAVGGRRLDDAAWFYPEPLENAAKVRDHLCFDPEKVEIEVDEERLG